MNKCFECESEGPLHNHHVVPQSLGGTKTIKLCEICHGKVHNKNMSTSALTKKALKFKKDKRERVSGWIDYGWCLSENKVDLLPVESEQAIAHIAIGLRNKGLSLRKIGAELTKQGLQSRSGRPWTAQGIKTILKTWKHDPLETVIPT